MVALLRPEEPYIIWPVSFIMTLRNAFYLTGYQMFSLEQPYANAENLTLAYETVY